MRYNTVVSAAVSLVAFAAPSHAYWRMQCPGRLLTARMDPIVNPGGISGHAHTISGGSAFNFEMTYEQTQEAACSSCPIKQDLSNYWVPNLYYQHQDGTFESVPQVLDGEGSQGGQVVYYLQRGGPNNDPLKAFPAGFRMLAGAPTKRTGGDDFASQAVSFVCMNYSGSSQYYNEFPDVACPDGVRAQIFFPSCWDGVNLDPADHKSHMAYPESIAYNNGPCPATHPVHMISLFYEVIFQTNLFDWWVPDGGWQPFVFSTGDPTGYGFHGDFVNGWDVDVLQNATDMCTNDVGGGDIFACPPFEFFDYETNQACIIPNSITEEVTGVLDALPGCNPVTYENAVSISGCANSKNSTIGAQQVYYTNMTGWEYVGCGADNGTDRTFGADLWWSNTMTIEGCLDYCGSKGYKYAGLEYANQCFCGNSLAEDRAPVEGILGNCFSQCAGNSTQYCGGAARLSIYELTGTFQSLTGGSSVAQMSCPQINGQNLTIGGNTYQFTCGSDFAANDIGMNFIQTAGNLTQCAQLCASTQSCTHAALSGAGCYMKTGSVASIASSGVNGVILISTNTTSTTSSASATASAPVATYTTAPTCPSSNGTYYLSTNTTDVFQIECGVDHAGGDLSSKMVPSLQACIELCASTSGCVDVSLASGTCYMKKTLGPASAVSYVLGAKYVGKSNVTLSTTTTTASSTTTTTTTKAPTTTTTTTTTKVPTTTTTTTTTTTKVPTTTTTTTPAALSTTTTVSVTTAPSSASAAAAFAAPTYTTAPSCPDSNSTYYQSSSTGSVYFIECGIDHYGGDLSSAGVSSFQACIELCATTKSCVDVSLASGTCYMKKTLGAAKSASYVLGAKLISTGTGPISTSTTTTVAASSSVTTVPAVSSLPTTVAASSSSSATTTAVASSSTTTTLATSATAAPVAQNQAQKAAVSSASPTTTTTTTAPIATSVTANCPQNNGTYYLDPASGYEFLLECGIDHQAGDMGMTYVTSFANCIAACASTTGCVDVSLSGVACYMKSTLGKAVYGNSNIQGAKLISTATASATTASATTASATTQAPQNTASSH